MRTYGWGFQTSKFLSSCQGFCSIRITASVIILFRLHKQIRRGSFLTTGRFVETTKSFPIDEELKMTRVIIFLYFVNTSNQIIYVRC